MGKNVAGLCLSTRLNLAFVCFLGCIIVYAVRSNISFAIVCMVNSTAIEQQNLKNPIGSESALLFDEAATKQEDGQCKRQGNSSAEVDKVEGPFVWDKSTQGDILGAFFYGYMSSQILAGYLASRYGAKLVIGIAVFGSAVLTLLSPLAANTSVYAFVGIRALLGFCQSATFPAMHSMWSLWAPPLERSVLTGISYAGAQIGNVLVMPMSGLLCKYGPLDGWPSIFYILGIFALLWCVLWFYYVADSPQGHSKITEQEREYITSSLDDTGKRGEDTERPAVPWMKILTSKAIWAIFVGHFAGDWGAYMMATSLPTFMNDVLGFDLTSMGFLSSVPYIFYFVCINLGGIIADTLQHKKIMSTVNTRRLAMLTALGSQALFLVLIGYCSCGQEALVILLITLSIGLSGVQYAGFVVNYLDVAPAFAGPILGIGNTLSCVAGILAPKFMGWLTPNGTKEEWQTVFYLTGAILVFGAVFFSIFAKGEVEPWAMPKQPPKDITETLLPLKEAEKETDQTIHQGA